MSTSEELANAPYLKVFLSVKTFFMQSFDFYRFGNIYDLILINRAGERVGNTGKFPRAPASAFLNRGPYFLTLFKILWI